MRQARYRIFTSINRGVETFFRQRAIHFIFQHLHDPILVQYGSDCTPLSTKERYEVGNGFLKFVRGGRASNEFLIQCCFIEVKPGEAVCILELPLPLGDKTAIAHLYACRKFLKTRRELGHEGLVVLVHRYDRALRSALDRGHRHFQRVLDEAASDTQDVGACHRSWLLNWWLCVGCVAHDMHGALKWSCLNLIRDKDLKEIWKG